MLAFSAPTWKTGVTPSATVSVETIRSAANRANEILPRLYLSDYATAASRKHLLELKVTHVISCLGGPPDFPKGVNLKRLHVPVEDLPFVDLLCHFEETNAFITQALEKPDAVVLVHCLMGMSRSASVVAAYLIATRRLSAPDAVAFVKKRRRIVRPNTGFMRQLEIFASQYGHPGPSPPPERNALAALLARDKVVDVKSTNGGAADGSEVKVAVTQGDVLSEALPPDTLVAVGETPEADVPSGTSPPAPASGPKGVRIAGLIRRYMANATLTGAARGGGKGPSVR